MPHFTFFKTLFTASFLMAIVQYSSAQTTVGLLQHSSGTLDDGYVLFAPMTSNTTYLIDKCGEQVKTWQSTYKPGLSCYILPDGTLLRTGNTNNSTFDAGGSGGAIQKIDWDGNVTWTYTISSTSECQHHDVKALPNGNVLAIVWEAKTAEEAIAQGRNPALTTATVWSEKIIEIEPQGATGGNIVWEWHLWDHLIQDFDNTKPNFGDVGTNPQLFDINYNASANAANGQDWIHLNSVDYNETLDQILLSSHSFCEVWIIDHSTSKAQAASHSGGNTNKGGDLLYRWGNPAAYDKGSPGSKKLFGQHNAQWIAAGFPYENQILIFNNGNGRPGGNYSTVEIIDPPLNGNTYTATLPYLPTDVSWIYNDNNTENVYAQNISGAEQLSNGNVIICDGPSGTFSEVDTQGNLLWKYVNPVRNTGPMTQGTNPSSNLVFRCSFYPSNYAGFTGHSFTPSGTIENSNTVSDACELVLSTAEMTLENDAIHLFPNPTSSILNIVINETDANHTQLQIMDQLGRVVYQETNLSANKYTIDVTAFANGLYSVLLITDQSTVSKKVVIR